MFGKLKMIKQRICYRISTYGVGIGGHGFVASNLPNSYHHHAVWTLFAMTILAFNEAVHASFSSMMSV